jgi:hypothetical protein
MDRIKGNLFRKTPFNTSTYMIQDRSLVRNNHSLTFVSFWNWPKCSPQIVNIFEFYYKLVPINYKNGSNPVYKNSQARKQIFWFMAFILCCSNNDLDCIKKSKKLYGQFSNYVSRLNFCFLRKDKYFTFESSQLVVSKLQDHVQIICTSHLLKSPSTKQCYKSELSQEEVCRPTNLKPHYTQILHITVCLSVPV